VNPELGFDLGFHAGFEVTVPFRALAGGGNTLTAIFRVVPEGSEEEPTYFWQKWTVPALDEDAKGTASLHGAFVVGEGNYQVDWLMRDGSDQFCSSFWRFSAGRRGKDRPVTLWVRPGMVKPAAPRPFIAEDPVERASDHPLSVLVLLHVAPQMEGAAALQSEEAAVLLSTVRSIAREPRIGAFSLVGFNIERHEVIYRQENAPDIDFPSLGEAVERLHLGTVTVEQLKQKEDGGAPFIADMLAGELSTSRPDAIIFVGPKGKGPAGAVRDSVKKLGAPDCPVFYLNYSVGPPAFQWGDVIDNVVKFWKGSEYTIEKPRDVYLAWADVMSRILRNKTESGIEVNSLRSSKEKKIDPLSYTGHR
jgi:hypothetical protein